MPVPIADWLFAIVLFVPLTVVLPVRLPKAPSPPDTALGVAVVEVWTVSVVVELVLLETDLAVELDVELWELPLNGWPVVEFRYQFAGGSLIHSPYRAVE